MKINLLGSRFCTFLRAITHRKHLEQELRQSAARLSQLMSRLLKTQEDERQRLARELHDELGQSLMVLKLRLRSLSQKLSPNQLPLKQECEGMLEYINEVVENVRRISQDLSPSILENLGLAAALGNLLDQYKKYYLITGSWKDLEVLNIALSPEAQINIYRIFQEVFTNIKKHSRSSQVIVNVNKNHDKFEFMISDNGRGFEFPALLDRPARKRGLGLLSLDERVRMLGGVLDIRSEAGSGTKIFFDIPIPTLDTTDHNSS
jgi:signal transduction histidine kinase